MRGKRKFIIVCWYIRWCVHRVHCRQHEKSSKIIGTHSIQINSSETRTESFLYLSFIIGLGMTLTVVAVFCRTRILKGLFCEKTSIIIIIITGIIIIIIIIFITTIIKVSEGNNANHYRNAFFKGKIASKPKGFFMLKSVFLLVYNPAFFFFF